MIAFEKFVVFSCFAWLRNQSTTFDFSLLIEYFEISNTFDKSWLWLPLLTFITIWVSGFNSKLQRLLGYRLLCALVGLLKTFWFWRANVWLIRLVAVFASNCLLRWLESCYFLKFLYILSSLQIIYTYIIIIQCLLYYVVNWLD